MAGGRPSALRSELTRDTVRRMAFRIDTASIEGPGTAYERLARSIARRIESGELEPGSKLPSVRSLAAWNAVNPSTVVAAYRVLEREGLVEPRAGSGMYVAPEPGAATADEEFGARPGTAPGRAGPTGTELDAPGAAPVDLATASPSPERFPTEAFKALLAEVLDRDGGYAFDYQESAGWPPLREAVADWLAETQGIRADPRDVIVVSGAQQGVDLCARALLAPGDRALVEDPAYRGGASAFAARGASVEALELDPDGLDPDALARVAERRPFRLVSCIPRFQNPSTISWSEERKRALLEFAAARDVFVLEDDHVSDLAYSGAPGPSLKALDRDDRVVYVKSFSKILMPGLRLAALVAPPRLRAALSRAKRDADVGTGGLAQRALELYLRRGLHRAHLESLKAEYGALYRAALEGLARLAPAGVRVAPPGGGLSLWVELPPGSPASALAARSKAAGVLVSPERSFRRPSPAAQDRHLRLSFAAVDGAALERGLRILATLLPARRSP